MSKMTLAQLVSKLQGSSTTYGWDALTLYDQRKANELLFQLYVERFTVEDGYIEPASMVASWGDGSYKEHISGLKLSAPRLSFESADPSLPAMARLTMDMIGGMIVSTKKNSGGAAYVSKILKILPVEGPQLWMSQPVTKGQVGGLGDVRIDISNADKFMANIVIGDLAMEEVGRRFKAYFEEQVPAELKWYPLGSLAGDLNGVLTPVSFEIKTMKSDPGARFFDEEYGDGAIMLFITLTDGKDGTTYPNANSTYLIPTDGNGSRYTGAMFLSNRILFEKIMRGPARSDIGHGIDFLAYTPANGAGQDVAWSLKGIAGGTDFPFVFDYKVRAGDFDATFETSLNPRFELDDGGPALSITAAGERIEFAWNKSYSVPFSRVIHWDFPTGDEWDYGDLKFDCNYNVNFDVVLDNTTGVVSFNRNESSSAFKVGITNYDYLPDLGIVGESMGVEILNYFEPLLKKMLRYLSTPTLDTFLIRNLLFPGHNALQLTEAFVPGDLAVFGEIDPLRTTTVLSPSNSTVEASSGFQFTLTPMPTDVTWSAKNVDTREVLPSVLSSTGYFTAPPQSALPNGFAAIVVTAKGKLDGKPVQSSALVSVLSSLIVINPTYDSCDPGDTKELSAESLSGSVLQWKCLTPEWGSTLEAVPGEPNRRAYTAGGSEDPDIPFSLDKIEITKTVNGAVTTAYIHVLISNQMVGTPMLISEASDPATGSVQFELRGKNGPIDPGKVIWKKLGGEGTFDDKTGVYTQPSSVVPGSFIVVSGTMPGDFTDIHAVAAVPLPLTQYAELIGALNVTLKAGINRVTRP